MQIPTQFLRASSPWRYSFFFFFGVARVCDVLGVAEILEFLVTGGDICLGGIDGNNESFSSSFGVLLVFA